MWGLHGHENIVRYDVVIKVDLILAVGLLHALVSRIDLLELLRGLWRVVLVGMPNESKLLECRPDLQNRSGTSLIPADFVRTRERRVDNVPCRMPANPRYLFLRYLFLFRVLTRKLSGEKPL
jgi:hypothetical protein